jgi:hypothetical protein
VRENDPHLVPLYHLDYVDYHNFSDYDDRVDYSFRRFDCRREKAEGAY